MRVIAGKFRGRRLRTVDDLSVRPATDRVKQTLFDMLVNRMEFDGCTVLDLFAGCGGLGIEALSRGSSHVTFVESNGDAARVLEENLRTLGCEGDCEVVQMDALAYLDRVQAAYDLVFADPPYAFPGTPGIPLRVFGGGMVSTDGYLLIEHAPDTRFTPSPLYVSGPEKKFGRTLVTFFRPVNGSRPGAPATSSGQQS